MNRVIFLRADAGLVSAPAPNGSGWPGHATAADVEAAS